MRNKTKKGFTLIELLVVISIIALLLSVMMPALTKAKEQAESVVCRSNLKQWGLCFAMYVVDNEEKFTLSFDPARGWISYFDWIGMMEPYFQDEDLFTCPSAEKYDLTGGVVMSGIEVKYSTTNDAWWYKPTSMNEPDFVGSYGMNSWVQSVTGTPQYGDESWYFEKSTSSTGTPLSQVPLFGDCMWIGGFPGWPTETANVPSLFEDNFGAITQQMNRYAIKRHNKGINMVFLDQSVRGVDVKELWGLKWNKVYETKNDYTDPTYQWPDWIN